MTEDFDFNGLDNIDSDENLAPSNWFKFKNVGDAVAGVFLDYEDKEASDGFGAQRVYNVLQKDGEEVKVAIALSKTGTIDRLKPLRKGDLVSIEFEKELPPSKKGHNPTKVLQVYIKRTPAGDATRAAEKSF